MAEKQVYHPVAHLGEPKYVASPVEGLHVFNPDHNLYCEDCGHGELTGDHGMIPGDGGASGQDFSPQYENDAIRDMYEAARGLTEYEETRPDWRLREFLDEEE